MNTEEVIAKVIALRNTKDAIKKERDAELAEYEAAVTTCENWLLGIMLERGETNIKTASGTAYTTSQMQVKLVDRAALVEWSRAENDYNMFTNAVSKDWCRAFIARTNEPPPGVDITTSTVVNVRKS
jgi:hypothetical protein